MTISKNPATQEILGEIPEQRIEDLRQAVERSRSAQVKWASQSIKERARCLYGMRAYIVEHIDEIAELIANETGKTKIDALSTEVLSSAMALSYYATAARRVLKRKRLSGGNLLTINKRSTIERVPYGVVGIISPWNYPLGIPLHEVAMALIAGNGVVLKVASNTLLVGAMIRNIVAAGGIPPQLFHLINLPGSVAGTAFLESGINKLFFTGSVAVGKQLMSKAAERLIPVSLELGGNDAMIVCRDANLHRAAAGALWAGLSNAGQSCAGVERLLVEKEIYDPFVRELKRQFDRLTQGVDRDSNVDIGSLSTEQQFKKVSMHVEDAVKKGALPYPSLAEIQQKIHGWFYPPVLLEQVDASMTVMQEEIFGPVIAIKKVESIDEAIAFANSSSLGLTSSVWTRDKRKARSIASRLQSGAVMINDHLMSHGLAETPWGGFKESGIGRTHSELGLEEMTQPRVVIDDILPGVQKNMWWYPHNRKIYEGLRGGLQFLYGNGLLLRIRGGMKLVSVFLRTFTRQ